MIFSFSFYVKLWFYWTKKDQNFFKILLDNT